MPLMRTMKILPGGGEATSYDMQIFNLVNEHRKQKGLAVLKYDEDIFNQCYIHSKNMSTGKTAFGHDGFSDRIKKSESLLWSC